MVTKKEIGNLKMIPFLPIQFIWWLFTKKGFFEVGIYGLLQRTIDKIQD